MLPCIVAAPTPTLPSPTDETLEFVTGEEKGKRQHSGYPAWVPLQNSVPMPLAQVRAVCR